MKTYELQIQTPLGEIIGEEFPEKDLEDVMDTMTNLDKFTYFGLVKSDGDVVYISGDMARKSIFTIVEIEQF